MNAIMNEQKSLQAIQRVKQAIEDIRQGKMVVMVDDEDRENEGDLVYAAAFSTPQKVNFMATHAKGLICVSVTKAIAKKLNLSPMVKENDSSYETAFTISVDAKTALTGISSGERDMTIKILANPLSEATQLVRPGHIFPLIAKEGGALARTGHTEGSVDLCKLAGVGESAVICEIIKEDGTMARRPDLDKFCDTHELNIVYISDIIEYRMMQESLVRLISEEYTEFLDTPTRKYNFIDHLDNHHIAYTFGKIDKESSVKFHAIGEDIDLLGDSKKYKELMQSIEELKGNGGVLIFMRNESKKMSEIRDYGIGAQIIKHLGIEEIKLLSTNERKEFVGLSGFGLKLVDMIKIG